jgi:hypothetical protein
VNVSPTEKPPTGLRYEFDGHIAEKWSEYHSIGAHCASWAVDGSCTDYVRVPFTISPEIIEAGIKRLASAWSRYERTRYQEVETLGIVV